MNKTILFLLLLSFNSISGIYSQQATFRNPVIHGDMADPSMIKIGDIYYATATSSEWAPFYPVFTSKDLVNWTQTGHIFDTKPEWTKNSFWAPELYYHNGKVYCYYTTRQASNNITGIGVAVADSPTGKFTDHGLLIEHGTEAIDAFIYDDNGQLYITWKAYGLDKRHIEIVGSKLSADGLRLEGEMFSLLIDDEDIGMEGQYHFKKGDYYYLVYAAHGCCGFGSDYDVYVARSKSFKGPYEKYSGNPILKGGNKEFVSSGHGTAVTTPDGRMFYMCHAYLKGDEIYMGRQPILQEMYVGDDGWVHFTTGQITKIEQPMPFPNTVQKPIPDFEEKFKDKTLKVEWTWNYPYSNIKKEIDKGKLYLSGTPIGDNLYGTALCVRATTPNYEYQAVITNKNESMKGLTMYGDDKNLMAWGVIGNKLELKSIKDGKESIVYESFASGKKLYLKVSVQEGRLLDFYRSNNSKEWIKINEAPIDFGYLARWDRVARPGLIHIGDPDQPAEISYFKLENRK